jgi:hypothetical protein
MEVRGVKNITDNIPAVAITLPTEYASNNFHITYRRNSATRMLMINGIIGIAPNRKNADDKISSHRCEEEEEEKGFASALQCPCCERFFAIAMKM